MSGPTSDKAPMPYGMRPTDRPVPLEDVSCSRCSRELGSVEGAVTIVGIADKLLWLYCQTCTGSSGFGR